MSQEELREKIEYTLDGYIGEQNEFNRAVAEILNILSTVTQEAVEKEREDFYEKLLIIMAASDPNKVLHEYIDEYTPKEFL